MSTLVVPQLEEARAGVGVRRRRDAQQVGRGGPAGLVGGRAVNVNVGVARGVHEERLGVVAVHGVEHRAGRRADLVPPDGGVDHPRALRRGVAPPHRHRAQAPAPRRTERLGADDPALRRARHRGEVAPGRDGGGHGGAVGVVVVRVGVAVERIPAQDVVDVAVTVIIHAVACGLTGVRPGNELGVADVQAGVDDADLHVGVAALQRPGLRRVDVRIHDAGAADVLPGVVQAPLHGEGRVRGKGRDAGRRIWGGPGHKRGAPQLGQRVSTRPVDGEDLRVVDARPWDRLGVHAVDQRRALLGGRALRVADDDLLGDVRARRRSEHERQRQRRGPASHRRHASHPHRIGAAIRTHQNPVGGSSGV